MLNAECNGGRQPAGWKTRDGNLWFPTQDGVAIINPEDLRDSAQPPKVVIEDLLLDNKLSQAHGSLEISPGQENLQIRYTGLSFIRPQGIRFKYKLVGLDDDWVDAGNRRAAYYSHLPPGEFMFLVIAANSDGVWNREGALIRIVVHPPFWRTWWFLSLSVIFVLGAAVLVYEYRVMRLKKARAAQVVFSWQLIESQEQERKRIAAELHDSLGQSLAIIKSRAALSLSQPEDHEKAIEQLDEISAAAVYAIDEVREIAYNLRPYQLDRLGLTRALETMLKKTADSNNIKFQLEIDEVDGIFEKESEINLYRIVQESVGNILKHAEATEARVAIKKGEREVEITIQDNGKGFHPETAPLGEAGRGGFGLFGIAERVHMMKGQHVINSTPGAGTTVTIKFDLKNKRERTNGGGGN
jgi:signal transduction histidine kinase